MKRFIEVTDCDGGMKVLVPIGKVTGIVCTAKGHVFIEMGTNEDRTSSGILVEESFEEVKRKIEEGEM